MNFYNVWLEDKSILEVMYQPETGVRPLLQTESFKRKECLFLFSGTRGPSERKMEDRSELGR